MKSTIVAIYHAKGNMLGMQLMIYYICIVTASCYLWSLCKTCHITCKNKASSRRHKIGTLNCYQPQQNIIIKYASNNALSTMYYIQIGFHLHHVYSLGVNL